MRQFPMPFLGWLLLALAPGLAHADQFESFSLDPTRSFIEFLSGTISAQLSTTDFVSASLNAQAGTGPVPLSGDFVMQIGNDATNPSFFVVLSGTSEVRPADGNAVSPGVGGGAGTTGAAFGLTFLDTVLGIGGDLAIHDLIFGVDGSFSLFANGLGPLGLQGDLAWAAAAGTAEISTDVGIGGTGFIPFTSSLAGFVFRNETQFSETSPGVYEVVLPYQFSIGIQPIAGPFSDASVFAAFQGEIVATTLVPEPGAGGLLALGLTLLRASRCQRSLQ